MDKKAKYTFQGMLRDPSKSKHPSNFYYDAKNIEILATDSQSSYSVKNRRGNSLTLTLPNVVINTTLKQIEYNNEILKYSFTNVNNIPEIERQINDNILPFSSSNHIILGHTVTRDSIILITTDNNGFDCIWEVEELLEGGFDLKLLYVRNLELSTDNPIQVLFNYENNDVQKIYWVDGNNQMRFLNIKQNIENDDFENIIDIDSSTINIVGNIDIKKPEITDVLRGGNHTAGMIQYAYNLYKLNSSQTKISPLTQLVPLNKGELGGGDLNEITGSIPVIKISDLDNNYSNIKLYAIKYTSLNQEPRVSLILDEQIPESNEVIYFDDGSVINDLSISEFTFLGSDPIIPKHIETKDNRLFSANYKEINFEVDLDLRAYAYDANRISVIYDNVRPSESNPEQPIGNIRILTPTSDLNNIPETFDAVNLDYDTYRFQLDGNTFGGEGQYLKYTLRRKTYSISEYNNLLNPKFYKDNEIYRHAIEFYNNLGQVTRPIWIADFKATDFNLGSNFNSQITVNSIQVELKPEFYDWLNDESNFSSEADKPVGYRILRAERKENDKTIISQGILNGMVANYAHSSKFSNLDQIRQIADSREAIKLPSLMRSFESITPIIKYKDYFDTASKNENDINFDNLTDSLETETPKASSSRDWRAQTFQYNKMMQLFSPEFIFNSSSLNKDLRLRVLGLLEAEQTNNWSVEFNTISGQNYVEAKFINGYNVLSDNVTTRSILGNPNFLMDFGLFGSTNSENTVPIHHIYKRYNNIEKNNIIEKEIYGFPELSSLGENFKNYNNDGNLRYANNLRTQLVDSLIDSNDANNDAAQTLIGTLSNGAPSATIVLGPDDPSYNIEDRDSIEDLYDEINVNETNGALVAELIIPDYLIYLGNIYGGNSYESKRRNEYIRIGEYQDINNNINTIDNPGDTFLQRFTFEKLSKTNDDLSNTNFSQVTEIVSFYVETTIDLRNRNDLSLQEWDTKFQPNFEEYHKYNTVYSQESNILVNQDLGFKFKAVNNFDNRIISSKLKIPGEFIDSWSDFQVNEIMDLDGKYGPINCLVNFKDNIYSLQDTGVSYININPRVQTQANDGISIELGTGSVLYDYNYLTTKSGTINKWSVQSTQNGFYYLDLFNKAYYSFNNNQLINLSDVNLFHEYFENNLDFDILSIDNPILKTGISTGYDISKKDIYLTTLQEDKSFTLRFNEKENKFIEFTDFKPSFYINKGFRLLTTESNNDLWEHYIGEYSNFYGVKYPSYVTLMINPESDMDCIFNNIKYKSELYLNDIDQFDKTLTHIQAYNEYQDTGKIPLINSRRENLRRRFRDWEANIPRVGRQRIRNPWIFLKLELDTEENYKLILHDIIVSYKSL